MWVVGLRVRRGHRPVGGAVIKTLCPSGLRGWTQVPLARAAWVQIPQVSLSCRLFCVVLAFGSCRWLLRLGTATPVGFEPTRGDPIGLAGRRLNHSAKVSLYTFGRLRLVCVCVCGRWWLCSCMARGSCCVGVWSLSVGYIAQWLERLTADQQVPGSNPGVPCFFARLCLQSCLGFQISGHPESNQGPSDCCIHLQSDALPTEL
jgi:hypothetical protein